MPLHPQAQAFVNELAEQKPPSWAELGVEQAREVFLTFAPMFGPSPDLWRVEDHQLPDGLRLRLYADNAEASPVVLFFHGGGWVLGNLDTHDALCRRLAKDSACTVIAVDYGLAPENRFPGPIDDCYRAMKFIVEHAASLKVDATKLAVAGDSAGGHLAASVAIKARDESGPKISLQVLMYPVIEPKFDSDSYQEFASGFGLTRDSMQWFWKQFLDGREPLPGAVPSSVPSHSGLPDAIVVTAQYDVLRDEGVRYAEQMHNSGVNVSHLQYDGMLHAFLHFAGIFDTGIDAGKQIASEIGNRLRDD